MGQTEKKNKTREKVETEPDGQDDLDTFIEKRKIQNDALKKIVDMSLKPALRKSEKSKK